MIIEPAGTPNTRRWVTGLDRDEAMRLLTAASFGRVLYTSDSLPTIRLVAHIVEQGRIIVRTRLGRHVPDDDRAASDVVVGYEADDVDPIRHVGWSVTVTGYARTVTDPVRSADYLRRLPLLHPIATDSVIAIEPVLISGVRIVERAG